MKIEFVVYVMKISSVGENIHKLASKGQISFFCISTQHLLKTIAPPFILTTQT
jgi:hypothetical protein